jgi:DNA primase
MSDLTASERIAAALERIADYCDRVSPPRRAKPTVDYALAQRAMALERGRVLTAILLRHPVLLRDVAHAFAGIELDPTMDRLRAAMLDWARSTSDLEPVLLQEHLIDAGLQGEAYGVVLRAPVPLPTCASPAATVEEAFAGWWHIFGTIDVRGLSEEIRLAEAACAEELTPERQRHLVRLKAALNRVNAGEPDDFDLARS